MIKMNMGPGFEHHCALCALDMLGAFNTFVAHSVMLGELGLCME